MKTSFWLFSFAVLVALIVPGMWYGLETEAVRSENVSTILLIIYLLQMFFLTYLVPILLIVLIICSWIYQGKFFAISYTLVNVAIIAMVVVRLS